MEIKRVNKGIRFRSFGKRMLYDDEIFSSVHLWTKYGTAAHVLCNCSICSFRIQCIVTYSTFFVYAIIRAAYSRTHARANILSRKAVYVVYRRAAASLSRRKGDREIAFNLVVSFLCRCYIICIESDSSFFFLFFLKRMYDNLYVICMNR
jgi:hypothetical protein